MPKLAANLTMMFNEVEFLDRFQAAAKAGFKAVEYLFPYDFEAELIADKLAAAGLTQALFNMPPGDWSKGDRGTAALPGRKEEFRRSVAKAVAYGKVINTPLLHMMAGIAESADTAARAAYLDSLKFAADLTGEAGIGLVIEPINRRDMPEYFLNDFAQAAELVAAVDRPHVKLQYDIYHRQILHGDVLVSLEALLPIVGHVQIASVPKRNEPGTGELDDFRILRRLDELGYDGLVGCEYRPAGDTVTGLSWIDSMKSAAL
ncbi:2-oxo-tetronate isomerase [Rhizobium sp. 18055]|uniref:2-oxo-tetronate isomerase n=1 Tax=Rhizobium sp. 18055 TaxID=2681403 RepID=UPI00135A5F8B|nr:2-oxo-tetronate isomerase [Rhizobium sp. 18055]